MNVKRKIILGITVLSLFSGLTSVDATIPTPIKPVPNYAFKEIYARYGPSKPKQVIEDRFVSHVVVPSSKPKVSLPVNPVIVVSVVPKASTGNVKTTGHVRRGVASYYCLAGHSRCTVGHSGGMYAAIRRDLLFLRGKTVQVCKIGTSTCIYVRIIDCNCGPNANLIDLYSDAFRKLTPLSMGVVKVTVKW